MRTPALLAILLVSASASVRCDDSIKDALKRAPGVSVPTAQPSRVRDLKPLGDDMAGVMGLVGAMSGQPMACYGVDELHLEEAVTKARELAGSCLIDGGRGLSPALGRRMLDNGAKSASFHCRYGLKNAQAVTIGKDQPDIQVRLDQGSRPAEETSTKEMRYLDMTVFHELLHSVDPDGKLMYSLYSHNEGGPFPDSVYACEFACWGELGGYDSVLGRLLVFEILVKPVPEKQDYACPPAAGALCSSLKKFAWLCANGPVDLDGEEERAQNVLEDAICLRKNGEDLIKIRKDYALGQQTYDAALDALKFGEAKHLDKSDPTMEAKLLSNMARVVASAMNADFMDKVRFSAFLKSHDCPSLP